MMRQVGEAGELQAEEKQGGIKQHDILEHRTARESHVMVLNPGCVTDKLKTRRTLFPFS